MTSVNNSAEILRGKYTVKIIYDLLELNKRIVNDFSRYHNVEPRPLNDYNLNMSIKLLRRLVSNPTYINNHTTDVRSNEGMLLNYYLGKTFEDFTLNMFMNYSSIHNGYGAISLENIMHVAQLFKEVILNSDDESIIREFILKGKFTEEDLNDLLRFYEVFTESKGKPIIIPIQFMRRILSLYILFSGFLKNRGKFSHNDLNKLKDEVKKYTTNFNYLKTPDLMMFFPFDEEGKCVVMVPVEVMFSTRAPEDEWIIYQLRHDENGNSKADLIQSPLYLLYHVAPSLNNSVINILNSITINNVNDVRRIQYTSSFSYTLVSYDKLKSYPTETVTLRNGDVVKTIERVKVPLYLFIQLTDRISDGSGAETKLEEFVNSIVAFARRKIKKKVNVSIYCQDIIE